MAVLRLKYFMSLTRTGEVFINKLQGLKKSSLFPEITWVKLFLSPARPHKPNVYKNIYFLFQKKHTQKNISLALLFVRIYIYIYINIYIYIYIFAAAGVKNIFVTRISGNKCMCIYVYTCMVCKKKFFWFSLWNSPCPT